MHEGVRQVIVDEPIYLFALYWISLFVEQIEFLIVLAVNVL